MKINSYELQQRIDLFNEGEEKTKLVMLFRYYEIYLQTKKQISKLEREIAAMKSLLNEVEIEK